MTTKQLQKAEFINLVKAIFRNNCSGYYDRLEKKTDVVYFRYIVPKNLREKEQYRIKTKLDNQQYIGVEDMKNQVYYELV